MRNGRRFCIREAPYVPHPRPGRGKILRMYVPPDGLSHFLGKYPTIRVVVNGITKVLSTA